jgi:hypothetical protein
MKSRTGKIARLPCPIREELNERLEAAQPGAEILAWLNGLAEVKEILKAGFGGDPITKQNLSHWRQNGHRDWLGRRDLRAGLGEVREFPADWREGEDLEVIDSAATVMAARLGCLLAHWNGKVSPDFKGRSHALNGLCLSVVRLQNEMHRSRGEKSRKASHCIATGSGGVQGSPKQSNHQKAAESNLAPAGNAVANPSVGGIMGVDNSQTQR